MIGSNNLTSDCIGQTHGTLSYLKCQIIGANDLLDQQEVAFSKHMHMAT